MTDQKWKFDRKAIGKAKERLGIRKVISFKAMAALDNSYEGYHMYVDGKHQILVPRDMGSRRVSQVLWHELTHALQLERDYACDIDAYNSDYHAGMVELGCYDASDEWEPTLLPGEVGYKSWLESYLSHPMEAEALKNERHLSWRYPLVTSAFA